MCFFRLKMTKRHRWCCIIQSNHRHHHMFNRCHRQMGTLFSRQSISNRMLELINIIINTRRMRRSMIWWMYCAVIKVCRLYFYRENPMISKLKSDLGLTSLSHQFTFSDEQSSCALAMTSPTDYEYPNTYGSQELAHLLGHDWLQDGNNDNNDDDVDQLRTAPTPAYHTHDENDVVVDSSTPIATHHHHHHQVTIEGT